MGSVSSRVDGEGAGDGAGAGAGAWTKVPSETSRAAHKPFTADIAVSVDDVIEKKLAAMEALESQFYEGGCNGGPHLVPDPKDANAVAARKKQVREEFEGFFSAPAQRYRAALGKYYGSEAAGKIRFAEAFEICEYGRRPSPEEILKLFPFLPAK